MWRIWTIAYLALIIAAFCYGHWIAGSIMMLPFAFVYVVAG